MLKQSFELIRSESNNHFSSLEHKFFRMAASYKFEGWLGQTLESVHGKMQWSEFEPKAWEEKDIDIQVSHCGICGSDLHTLRSGWGDTPYRKISSLVFSLSFIYLLNICQPAA